MGRKRKHDKHLPRRVYISHGAFYFVDANNKWHPLGRTEHEMFTNLARLKLSHDKKHTMAAIMARYESEVLPTKAPATSRTQAGQLRRLVAAFGHMEIGQVKRSHVAAYLDARTSKVAANREIALFSHVFTKAIRWGLHEGINPCMSMERNKEKPARRYISDSDFLTVYKLAPAPVRFAMAIAYLTGQRQADILNLKRGQFSDQGIVFTQAKTGAAVLVAWSPALTKAVNRAIKHGGAESITWVVHDGRGNGYTSSGFQTAWQRLMKRCTTPDEHGNQPIAERFTFRDIRAKARSDGDDKHLLGHANPDAMARIYQRKPVPVSPVK